MKNNKYPNRREFLKTTGNVISGAVLFSSAPFVLRGGMSNRMPNVVFIITDQMRGDALSCLGSQNARTPNLDNMAEEGVIFENGFSNNPICVPSRISMFTGLYPNQHGALNNRGPLLNSLGNTLFHLLRKKGYRIGFIGKNHMIQPSLLKKSLDTCIIRGREPFRAYSEYVPPFWHCDTYWSSEKCYTALNTNDAVQFINNKNSDKPFFLGISYFDPHPPYMAPSEYTSRFSSKDMVLPEYIPASDLSTKLDEFFRAMKFDQINDSDLIETFRYYYASISYIDDMVGRVIDVLKRKGILDNTIVIFTSDHGDFMGEHRMVRKGMCHYDALLHVPNIWYAPGFIENRFRVKNLAQSVDFLPTIADFLGVNLSGSLPGRSLKPFLQGDKRLNEEHSLFAAGMFGEIFSYLLGEGKMPENHKDIPLHTRVLRNLHNGLGKKTAMIRTIKWKFIKTEGYPDELYKMDGGWIERENLARKPEYANLISSLKRKIEQIWTM